MLGSATPERMPDGRTVWYGYIEDVTSQRELEQARRDALVAEAASRAKTQFLGRMSHELRTPLNAVLGFAQLMEIDRDEPPLPGQARRLRLVREAGEHLLRMIGDLLDLTRIEAGGMALHPELLAPRVVAEQAIAMVADAAARAQVTLALEIGADAEALFEADRARLLQVLLNLLSNAVKYNRPGGGATLRVSAVNAGGETDAPGTRAAALRWDVVDTGVGITADDLGRVFEPFQRGAQEGGPVEGAGIGLAVTQAVVTLMGGRIEARSEPGAGSTFSVTLPRR
jgi:signal transduction histidine kinase